MRFLVLDFKDIFDREKLISSTEYIEKKKFTDDGIFSEKIFGENSDNQDIDILGWIDFGETQIISPIFFSRIKKLIKVKNLNKIINFEVRTDENGNFMENNTIKFQNIGVPGFIQNFEEIMEEYADKSLPEYETVMKAYEEEKLFISVFPVFSAKLRPGVLFSGSKNTKSIFKYDDINMYYNLIVAHSNKISENREKGNIDVAEDLKTITYPEILKLQETANYICDLIINNFLKSKKGICRKLVASTRVNYSARNVLTPIMDIDLDCVALPYLTFLELYRFLLINLMVKTEGITFNKADERIQAAKNHFDKKIYKYMNELVKKSKLGLRIILNRNPSINLGSLLLLQIQKVKDDYSDLTLSVNNSILANLNADYDGDVLNIIALLGDNHKTCFENLKPSRLIISKNDGKFDRGYGIAKDARSGYYILNNT